jgi:hypothetical protein
VPASCERGYQLSELSALRQSGRRHLRRVGASFPRVRVPVGRPLSAPPAPPPHSQRATKSSASCVHLCGGYKLHVPIFQCFGMRSIHSSIGDPQRYAGHLLETVQEHRAVLLVKDVSANLYYQVRADAEDVGVVRGMMNLAQSQTIGYLGNAALRIGGDVRSVEQFRMAQVTDGATCLVCLENPCPEYWLVKTLPGHAICVCPFGRASWRGVERRRLSRRSLFQTHDELVLLRFLGD